MSYTPPRAITGEDASAATRDGQRFRDGAESDGRHLKKHNGRRFVCSGQDYTHAEGARHLRRPSLLPLGSGHLKKIVVPTMIFPDGAAKVPPLVRGG